MFEGFLRNSNNRRQQAKKPRGGRRRRPQLAMQRLEDRRLLASFIVNSNADSGAGTLREAVTNANATPGADTISFDASVTSAIVLTSPISITDEVTITGDATSRNAISTNATPTTQVRHFEIDLGSGAVVLENLQLTDGRVDDGGGSIYSLSDDPLTLRNSVVTGNEANNGGAIYLENDGTLNIESSEISNNRSTYAGGGAIQSNYGEINITDSTLDNNEAEYGDGGAINHIGDGRIVITNSNITNNENSYAGYNGGAIYAAGGDVLLTGSVVSGNTSAGDGGAIYGGDGDVTADNTEFSNNTSSYVGGAIHAEVGDVVLTGSQVRNNQSIRSSGGGLSVSDGNVRIESTIFETNLAVRSGGGISSSRGVISIVDSLFVDNQARTDGGGIFAGAGSVGVSNTTFSDNRADQRGGAIKSDSATVHIVNSTLTENTAFVSGGGIGTLFGTISNQADPIILIHNSILQGNSAPVAPDLNRPNDLANLSIQHSLIGIAFDTETDGGLTPSATPDADGNIIGTTGSPADAQLLPLASNGGPLQTHNTGSSSPALDRGDNALAIDIGPDGLIGTADDVTLTNDARGTGFDRIAASSSGTNTVDMGAVEQPATAQLIVDTLDDVINGNFSPGNRSLREMLLQANTNPGEEVIRFSPELDGGTITLTSGVLSIQDSVRLVGLGATNLTIETPDGGNHRIFEVTAPNVDLSIEGLHLVGGTSFEISGGGAIRHLDSGDLSLDAVMISDSLAGTGGAIAFDNGDINILGSTFFGNQAISGPGAVQVGSAGNLVAVNSTFTGNTTTTGAGAIGTLSTSNAFHAVTIVDNEGSVGGVSLPSTGSHEITSSIVADNTGSTAADLQATTVTLASSLIGDNTGSGLTAGTPNGSGGVTPDSNGNLIGGSGSDSLTPNLLALADNGGRILTRQAAEGSIVINASLTANLPADVLDADGDIDVAEALPVDARGRDRVIDSAPDIGAIENVPPPNITFDSSDPIVFGTPLSATQLDNQVSVEGDVTGTFEFTPPVGTTLNAGLAQTLSVTFTPLDIGIPPATTTTSIDVFKADPLITWVTPDPIVFGDALTAEMQSATASGIGGPLPGTYVYDFNPGDIPSAAGMLDLSVMFTPDDTDNYNVVNATVTLEVQQATPVIVWNEPDSITEGTAISSEQLNATVEGGVPGTFIYTPAAGTILGLGNDQTLSVQFVSADANFANVETTVTIDVVSAVLLDFGDAPAGFPVTLANDGARHVLGGGLFLGSGVTDETDGIESENAASDTNDDGVVVSGPMVASAEGSITYVDVAANGTGRLDAWIDFNADGDWDDIGEQITTSLDLASGDNRVSFSVPAGVVAGSKAARFRLSTAGGLSTTGEAADGEVEDYVIVFEEGPIDVTYADDSASTLRISYANDQTTIRDASSDNVITQLPSSVIQSMNVDPAVASILIDDSTLGRNGTLKANAVEISSGAYPSPVVIESASLTLSGLLDATVVLDGDEFSEASSGDEMLLDVSSATIDEGNLLNFDSSNGANWRITETRFDSEGALTVIDGEDSLGMPTVLLRSGTPWHHIIEPLNVNNTGDITAGDAILVINALISGGLFDENDFLVDPATLSEFPNQYLDTTGDNKLTPLDALLVINFLISQGSGEGESIAAVSPSETVAIIDSSDDEETEQSEEIPSVSTIDVTDHSNGPACHFDESWEATDISSDSLIADEAHTDDVAWVSMADDYLTMLGSDS
ncbi:MAG: GEVED domain-containing protein [Planctomycetota bacterium]